MPDPTADTAAAMLKAVRAAQLSNQPLAVGLADALDELVQRECVDYDDVMTIANHLRNNNHV